MDVVPATSEDLDALVELWIDLAAGQREYGSHIVADSNRSHVREILSHAVVANEVLVARTDGEGDGAVDEGSAAVDDGPATDARPETADRAGSAGGERAAGELLGFATISLEQGNYVQDCTRGMIENLFVRPSARDRGIGAQLLESAEARLREAGAAVVALEAMADNEAARRFYRRHGYELHRVELEKRLDRDDDPVDDQESTGSDTDTRLDG